MAGELLLLGLFDGAGDVPSGNAVFYDILEEVQNIIDAMGLDGAPTIVIRKVPVDQGLGLDEDQQFPVIVVAPWKDAFPPEDGTDSADDIVYSIIVMGVMGDDREGTFTANLNRALLWRQTIRRAFHHKPFGAVGHIANVEAQLLEPVIREAWATGLLASPLLLNFTSRETRGAA